MAAAFSFPKSRRLRKRADFLAVQRGGATLHGRYFVVVYEERGSGRLGITVSKKVGNAVVRNRIKRLVREFVRTARPIPVVSPPAILRPSSSESALDPPAVAHGNAGWQGAAWHPPELDVVVIARAAAQNAAREQLLEDLRQHGPRLCRAALEAGS